MGLKDLMKKRDGLGSHDEDIRAETVARLATGAPEFTFIRSDTISQEVIHPPSYGAGAAPQKSEDDRFLSAGTRLGLRSRSASTSSTSSNKDREHVHRRLSQRLGLRRSPAPSENVPTDLPEIVQVSPPSNDAGEPDKETREAIEEQWERRATILATTRSGPPSPNPSAGPFSAVASPRSPISPIAPLSPMSTFGGGDTPKNGSPNLAAGPVPTIRHDDEAAQRAEAEKLKKQEEGQRIDAMIQEAIKLHEDGELTKSTELFSYLANPRGANNPLSQVLYGLAMRHGWGCRPDPETAIRYLTMAAANSAAIEQKALQSGMKKGGAAKGELVLSIFELANCFRHGWGTKVDLIAAKQYYETAANLGDTDAMNEIAQCYLDGIGCKKDKFAAARYYRLAEKNGAPTLGNSWIWKDKYDPGFDGKKKKR